MESFPIQFCKGIRSYWRRRKYQKLKSGGNKTSRVTRLGGGAGRGSSRRFRLRNLRSVFRIRIRIRALNPIRILARIRDAYVDSMLGVASKGAPGLTSSGGPETMLGRRIPMARPVRPELGDFEKRLILEIYKSVTASAEFAALDAS